MRARPPRDGTARCGDARRASTRGPFSAAVGGGQRGRSTHTHTHTHRAASAVPRGARPGPPCGAPRREGRPPPRRAAKRGRGDAPALQRIRARAPPPPQTTRGAARRRAEPQRRGRSASPRPPRSRPTGAPPRAKAAPIDPPRWTNEALGRGKMVRQAAARAPLSQAHSTAPLRGYWSEPRGGGHRRRSDAHARWKGGVVAGPALPESSSASPARPRQRRARAGGRCSNSRTVGPPRGRWSSAREPRVGSCRPVARRGTIGRQNVAIGGPPGAPRAASREQRDRVGAAAVGKRVVAHQVHRCSCHARSTPRRGRVGGALPDPPCLRSPAAPASRRSARAAPATPRSASPTRAASATARAARSSRRSIDTSKPRATGARRAAAASRRAARGEVCGAK